MSTSSSEVEHRQRRGNSRTPPAFKAALDKFAASGHKPHEQRGLVRMSPSSRGARMQRPRTAPLQRSAGGGALSVTSGQPSPQRASDGGGSIAGCREMSRSCEQLYDNKASVNHPSGSVHLGVISKDSHFDGAISQDDRCSINVCYMYSCFNDRGSMAVLVYIEK